MTFFEPAIPAEQLGNEDKKTVALRKELRDKCKAKSPRVEIMKITSEVAALMLERNREENRKQSQRTVARYKKEFDNKRMMLTNQGIGFDANGYLVDGQHRLEACVASKKDFESIVAFGLDPETFLYVDSGLKRTPGHKVGIAGFSDPINLAAAARVVLINDLAEIDLNLGRWGIQDKARFNPLPDEFIVDFLRETPKFVDMLQWYSMYRRFKPVSNSLLHATHWMIAEKHPKLGNAYFEQLCYGESLSRSENVYRLREHLNNIYLSREKIGKAWQACWIIDAFNDTRRGKTTKFVMTEGRDFPKVLS